MAVVARRFVLGHASERGTAPADSDEELLARVRAGDDLAFEAIYDRYATGVLAFCAHLLGSRDAAEDALQFTFVAAYRALRRGGEREIAVRPWLYTIARNRCISDLRARREADFGDDVLDQLGGGDAPLVQVQRREELRELLADMQRLPADQRAALTLFELGDQSHAEIAVVLGVRREKVKALIFQAREALVRGRKARERPCAEVRERLATDRGRILPRSMTRAHIDRCPACAAYEAEVGRQRAAFALLVPVAAAGKLKASVLSSALGGGGGVATPALSAGGGGAAAGGGGDAGRRWRERSSGRCERWWHYRRCRRCDRRHGRRDGRRGRCRNGSRSQWRYECRRCRGGCWHGRGRRRTSRDRRDPGR